MNRNYTHYDGDEIIAQGQHDVSWEQVRINRTIELKESDWRAVSDREMTNEWRDYRQFLRDLPQNYYDESDEVTQGANAAADAWEEYDKPEE